MMDGSEYIFGPNCILLGWKPHEQYLVALAPLVFFLDSFHFLFSEIIFDIEVLKSFINGMYMINKHNMIYNMIHVT